MRYTTAGTLAACLAAASAFKDTSPFLLMSTAEFPSSIEAPSIRQLQSSKDVLEVTKGFLKTCPSDIYFIVSQPMVSADDLSRPRAFPYVRREMLSENIRAKFSFSEVVGDVKPKELQDYIVSNCEASVVVLDGSDRIDSRNGESFGPIVARVDLESLPMSMAERVAQLAESDLLIYNLFNDGREKKYTLIYTTTPVSQESVRNTPSYEAVFMEPYHTELKRQATNNSTPPEDGGQDRRPLFEKYQFFTPGLFMGLLITFILLSILTVGLRALGSLQVSYGAFDKEMGPAANKK